jgi:hypothetical protein
MYSVVAARGGGLQNKTMINSGIIGVKIQADEINSGNHISHDLSKVWISFHPNWQSSTVPIGIDKPRAKTIQLAVNMLLAK